MNREYVVPGVDHRARNKFAGCCGCCRMFIDYFGGGASRRRPLGDVGNGWITANGDCSIENIDVPGGPKQLVMSGPDCMLVRDMRVPDFTTVWINSYVPGGFTLGAEFTEDGYIIFHPEKEYRFLFNWVDKDNFDFISYWDWDLLQDYTIAKVGTREGGSERFFMPAREGIMINGYTYTLRSSHRKFCYVDDVIFIDSSSTVAGNEFPGSAWTYSRPLRSKLCGIGTGPSFTSEVMSNFFVETKPAPEEQKHTLDFAGGRDIEDCRWCPRPNAGCKSYVIPLYIIAERFDGSGISQGIVNAGPNTNNDSGNQYYVGSDTGNSITLTIDPDIYSPFGFPIPNPTAGTIRINSGISPVIYNWKLESSQVREDCDGWDKLRIPSDPSPGAPLFGLPGEGYWEITGVYE